MKKRCLIIGAGYSLEEEVRKGLWDKIKGQEIWSCNYAYKTMSYLPNKQFWVDTSFFRHNAGDLQKLNKDGVKCYAKKSKMYAAIENIIQYEATRDIKLVNDKFIYTSSLGLTGVFALSIAIRENYEEIYLLGFDFGVPKEKMKDNLTHYYQNKLNVKSTGVGRPIIYMMKDGKVKKDVKSFDYYLPHKDKIFIVGFSNIHQFQKISYEEMYKRLK